MPGPLFFVDRSLGRVRVPGLLRDAGWSLLTLAEHYGIPQDEVVDDVEWLKLAGERGWPVLMKDERIRYRAAERRALLAHGVRAFCLTSGNLTSAQMAHEDQPVERVASLLGFPDASNFVKYFAHRTSTTPAAFRARSRGRDHPPGARGRDDGTP